MQNINRKRQPYDKFKRLLFATNINQKELARWLCKSYSCVNRVLNGRGGQFTYAEFKIIQGLFEITIHDYF